MINNNNKKIKLTIIIKRMIKDTIYMLYLFQIM